MNDTQLFFSSVQQVVASLCSGLGGLLFGGVINDGLGDCLRRGWEEGSLNDCLPLIGRAYGLILGGLVLARFLCVVFTYLLWNTKRWVFDEPRLNNGAFFVDALVHLRTPVHDWRQLNRFADSVPPPLEARIYTASPGVVFRGQEALLCVEREGKRPFHIRTNPSDLLLARAFGHAGGRDGLVREMAISRSPAPVMADLPGCQVGLYGAENAKSDATRLGFGFRYGSYIVTADHVLQAFVACEKRVLRTETRQALLSLPVDPVGTFPPSSDIGAFRVDPDIFAVLGLKTAKLGHPTGNLAVVTGYNVDRYESSYGKMEKSRVASRMMHHTMTTYPGHSGAPIFQGPRVVALHLGAKPELDVNYCVSLRSLDYFLDPANSVTPETENPEYALDSDQYETEIDDMLRTAHRRSGPSSNGWSHFEDVYDTLKDLRYGDSEGAREELRYRIDQLRNLMDEQGDEDAARIVRAYDSSNGFRSSMRLDAKRRREALKAEPRVNSSTTPGATSSSTPRLTWKKQTPEATGSVSSVKPPQSDPSPNMDLQQLFKQLKVFETQMNSLLSREESAKASATSPTLPEVDRPSSPPCDSKQEGSSKSKTAKSKSGKTSSTTSSPATPKP